MTPAIFSLRTLQGPNALPTIEALQPARAIPGTGAGQAFSDDPFARMLEQNRQSMRLEARRRQERDTATAAATAAAEAAATPPAPAAEPAPGPGPGQAPNTAPGSAAGARRATQDTATATVAGGDDVSSDAAKDARLAPGSPSVRRNLGLDTRPTSNRVAARNAGQPVAEAGGVERRLGDTPGEDAAGTIGKAAGGGMAAHVDGQGPNTIDRRVTLQRGHAVRTSRLSADAAERAAGQPDAGKLQLQATGTAAVWQPAMPARLQAALGDPAASGRAFADAAVFMLADMATPPERAASAAATGFSRSMPASAGLIGDISSDVGRDLKAAISAANSNEIGSAIGSGNNSGNSSANSSASTHAHSSANRSANAADLSSPTATATQAMLQAAPGSHSFGLQLGTQVTLWLKDGIQNAQLQLNPAELGPVSVTITLDGQAAQVSFSAEQSLTRQALEQALPTLAGTLAEAGFTLAGGGVFDQARQGGQPGRDEAPLGRAFGNHDGQALNGSTGTGSGTSPGTNLPPRQRGMVDLVA